MKDKIPGGLWTIVGDVICIEPYGYIIHTFEASIYLAPFKLPIHCFICIEEAFIVHLLLLNPFTQIIFLLIILHINNAHN